MATGDDEYVTIELLGEIDEETPAKPELALTEEGRVYIAPVINIDAIRKAKRKEIRDAIPVHGRGQDVFINIRDRTRESCYSRNRRPAEQ